MNNINLTGHIASDYSFRVTNKGTKLMDFTLGIEGKEEDNFIRVRVIGEYSATIEKYCAKGDKIAISGKLINSSWKDGETFKNYTYVLAQEINFMQRKK